MEVNATATYVNKLKLFEHTQFPFSSLHEQTSQIPVIITQDRKCNSNLRHANFSKYNERVLRTVKRQQINNVYSELPVVMALNPRSIYNCTNELSDLIIQYNIAITGVSESWERENLPLKEIIQIENYKVITNVLQRTNRGGKPALIISEKLFHIKELCPNPITVPVGVEAVWALLKPKNKFQDKTIVQGNILKRKSLFLTIWQKP